MQGQYGALRGCSSVTTTDLKQQLGDGEPLSGRTPRSAGGSGSSSGGTFGAEWRRSREGGRTHAQGGAAEGANEEGRRRGTGGGG